MTAMQATYGIPATDRRSGFLDGIPGLIVAGCVLFNLVLCFLNTRVMSVSGAYVILCELALVGCALGYGARHIDRRKMYWLAVLYMQAMLLVVLSVAKEEILAKPLRDVLILPVFMLLGLSAYRLRFTPVLLALTGFVTLVALYEALAVDSFLNWFNVRDYFIAKGAENDFSYTDTDLFVSGIRPQGKFLFDFGFHRVSSVFLEPVSLGFYGFIAGAYAVAAKDRMTRRQFAALLGMALFLIWISDGRMALGALLLLLFGRPVFARLDHRFALLVFPALFLLSVAVYAGEWMSTEGEGTGARIHSTLSKLEKADLPILAGVSQFPDLTVDSALLDLINNHGLAGFLLFWLSPVLFGGRLPQEARVYLFGVSLFLALGFLFSAAIFTIKTAALLWFIYGYLVIKVPEPEPRRSIAHVE